jgi:hypothetical protein
MSKMGPDTYACQHSAFYNAHYIVKITLSVKIHSKLVVIMCNSVPEAADSER